MASRQLVPMGAENADFALLLEMGSVLRRLGSAWEAFNPYGPRGLSLPITREPVVLRSNRIRCPSRLVSSLDKIVCETSDQLLSQFCGHKESADYGPLKFRIAFACEKIVGIGPHR